jgi:hypothetical protein
MHITRRSLSSMRRFQILCARLWKLCETNERGVEYPRRHDKTPFSVTLDYYNRRGPLYTKPVTKLLLQELKRATRSRWFE